MDNKPWNVVCRAHRAGVWIGTVIGPSETLPGMLRLRARHIWRWEGALSTAGVAAIGPGTGSAITSELDVAIQIDDIVSLITATPEAMARLSKIPPSDDMAR